jgi:hypothetical protein
MNVNAKPLSELRRLEQCLAASTPFHVPPTKLRYWNEHARSYYKPALLRLSPSDELLVGIATAPLFWAVYGETLSRIYR